MKKLDYLLLFLVSLVGLFLLASIQKVPGYMDAEYYFGQAIRLAQGKGFSEPFIWNFLNNPVSFPVEGFTFWLPVTSIIASVGLWISNSDSFFISRIPFIIMAATIPLMAAYFANQFLPGRHSSWLAGGLALFSAFYLPFITITDTFTPYMFLGGVFLLLFNRILEKKDKHSLALDFLLIGLIIGLMTLTRSDGIIWLVAGVLVVFYATNKKDTDKRKWITHIALLIIGFCLVMIPWYLRNLKLFHALLPPGNRLMLWLTNYNELFVYPSNVINYSRWIENGFPTILLDRLKALGLNIQTFAASGGAIVLIPLMAFGYWKRRKNPISRLAGIMLVLLMCAMSFLFPYAGERGGFFHSLASVQIILWALVPVGLDGIVRWGINHRNWKEKRAWGMFGVAVLASTMGLSAFIMIDKVTNGPENKVPWNQTQDTIRIVESELTNHNINQNIMLMVNDPPGYSLVSNVNSVMIPSNGAGAILAACEAYNVDYLVLDDERQEIKKLMIEDDLLRARFDLIFETSNTQVYDYKP